MKTLEELRATLQARMADGGKITSKAQAEGRSVLSEEEDIALENILGEIRSLRKQIEMAVAEEELAAAEAAEEARIRAEAAASRMAGGLGGRVQVTGEPAPFASFGEQLQAIVNSSKPGNPVDERLLKVADMPEVKGAASGGAAAVDSDGGYLIQPTFTAEIMKRAYDLGLLASRCADIEVGENSNRAEVPYIDETSRATGSRWGGVQVYWVAEADTVTAKKPKIGKWECKVEKLMGLAYMTDELMADARLMTSVYGQAFAEEIAFMLDDAIFRGTGAGQPLGFMNASCLVTVAKEAGQAADTIVLENLVKMRARMWARSRRNGAWLINQDAEPQLLTLAWTVGTAGVPAYMPAGGVSGQPYDTLYGMPVLPIEHAATVGDLGDITLVDLSQYGLVKKGALEGATSMHVRFIYGENTLRFTQRVNGQPKWASALTPYKGANTLSPFVALAERA